MKRLFKHLGPGVTFLAITFILSVTCSPGGLPAEPSISLEPTAGGPGTVVIVTGVGFPSHTNVSIRLGPPDVGATPQTYGAILTAKTGSFNLSFTMPDSWLDGTPITEDNLMVVVTNDASIKAPALFVYQRSKSEGMRNDTEPFV